MAEYNYTLDEFKSTYHKKVVKFLRDEFPFYEIIQEFTIHINNKTLYCDIACQNPIKFIIEINPDHHYQYTPFFHKDYKHFLEIQENDRIKQKWAELNDYIYIVLKEKDFKNNKYKEILKEFLK